MPKSKRSLQVHLNRHTHAHKVTDSHFHMHKHCHGTFLKAKIHSLLQSFLKQKCQTFAGASLSQLSLMCLSLLFMMVNEESLGFRLLVGQRKQFEDVTLSVFHPFFFFT